MERPTTETIHMTQRAYLAWLAYAGKVWDGEVDQSFANPSTQLARDARWFGWKS